MSAPVSFLPGKRVVQARGSLPLAAYIFARFAGAWLLLLNNFFSFLLGFCQIARFFGWFSQIFGLARRDFF